MDISTIVIFSVLMYAAFKVGQWSILGELVSELQKNKETSTADNADEEKIIIEKHNETYYAFGDNDRFLAQGATFGDLFKGIKDRFPGKDFRIDKHPDALTLEETGKMVDSIFEVFGKKETK